MLEVFKSDFQRKNKRYEKWQNFARVAIKWQTNKLAIKWQNFARVPL